MFYEGTAKRQAVRDYAPGVETVLGDLDLDVLMLWEIGALPDPGLGHYSLNPWIRACPAVLRRALGH